MTGKISTFGGPFDSGMKYDEGLAIYEHNEADHRPDLFWPRCLHDPKEGSSKRLKKEGLYFAYRFPKGSDRKGLQNSTFWFFNHKNGLLIPLSLVDWGPHERTGRVFDLSHYAAELLQLKTDEEVECLNL